MDNSSSEGENPRVLKVLEALKQASHELQTHPTQTSHSAIKALLELENESDTILSEDPHLSTLSLYLSELKSLVQTLENSRGYSLRSFLTRRVSTHSISRVAGSIESEIQAWIDRESIEGLMKALQDPNPKEEKLVGLLIQFEERISLGFNRELQDLVLKSKAFVKLQSLLCDPNSSNRIREHAAFCVASLIRFNKDVFVGQVSMDATVGALISIRSTNSIRVLCALIRFIKSPFVDEIESNGEIPRIIALLELKELGMKIAALDCLLEIGYFGRKEAVEAMLKRGLVKRLVEMQRSELGGDLIEIGRFQEEEEEEEVEKSESGRQGRFLEKHPFASCVARFAVQLEVGEGLRQREKREFKREMLEIVRDDSSLSHAEAATIVAEVLWGSSP